MEEHLIIKDFVHQLKPIEIHLVPSKLRLNKKGFKDLKCNKDNKILLMSKNYFISCPNSEEESDICLSPKSSPIDKNANIKDTRKFLQKMKSGSLPKVMSRNLIESNCKLYQNDLKIEYDSDKGSLDLDDNLFLYDDNDFINYNMTSFDAEKENENKKTKECPFESQTKKKEVQIPHQSTRFFQKFISRNNQKNKRSIRDGHTIFNPRLYSSARKTNNDGIIQQKKKS
jgi:hypothetical protein